MSPNQGELKRESDMLYGATPVRPERRSGGRLLTSDQLHANNARVGEGVTIACTPLVEVDSAGRLEARPHAGFRVLDGELARHLLVVGPTGSGKDQRLLVNLFAASLLESSASQFVLSIKGPGETEAYREIARTVAPDAQFAVLALGSSSSPDTIGVLQECRQAGLVDNLIDALLASVVDRESNWWQKGSRRVLSHVVRCEHVHTLAEAGAIVSDVSSLRRFAEAGAIPSLVEDIGYFQSGSNGETSRADLANRVAPFLTNDTIRAVLSAANPTLVLTNLLKSGKRFVLVLEANEQTIASAADGMRLVLSLIMGAVTRVAESSPGGRLPRALHLHLNEFPCLGPVSGMATFIATARSRGVFINLYVQSLSQLAGVYGPEAAETIVSNCASKLYLLSGMGADRFYLAGLSGEQTVLTTKIHEQLDPTGDWLPVGREVSQLSKPVLSPEEILELSRNPHPVFGPYAVLMPVDQSPVLMHLTPSWEIPWLVRQIEVSRASVPQRTELPSVPLDGLVDGVIKRIEETERHLQSSAQSAGRVISQTGNWTEDQIQARLAVVEKLISVKKASESARAWWKHFKVENRHRSSLVLRLAEELLVRNANLAELYVAHGESACDNIQAVLHYLDYSRLKRQSTSSSTGPKIIEEPIDEALEDEPEASAADHSEPEEDEPTDDGEWSDDGKDDDIPF